MPPAYGRIEPSIWGIHNGFADVTGYRCHFLNSEDNIQAAENIEAERLDEAIDMALARFERRPHHHSIELWQGALRLYASREQLPRHQAGPGAE
jgi:hypothetical protein